MMSQVFARRSEQGGSKKKRGLGAAEGPYLVGLSHCVVRVIWFKYWIRPDAVLLSSQLAAGTTDAVKHPHNHKTAFGLSPTLAAWKQLNPYVFTTLLDGSTYGFGIWERPLNKLPPRREAISPKLTHPSGRSLSNSRLQSTTGPPVPIRSLDCRLTAATHGRQMHALDYSTAGLRGGGVGGRHRQFIETQSGVMYLY